MNIRFATKDLDRLEADPSVQIGLPPAIIKAYRKRLGDLRDAVDLRDLYAFKSWRFEKLQGKRSHQHSIRLNDQFRLIVELEEERSGPSIAIVGIEDYH